MQKQPSEQTRTYLQVLEKTFSGVHDAVFILNVDTRRIVACNQAAAAMFGYGRAEMVGRTPDFLHVDAAAYQAFRQRATDAMEKEGALRDFEFRVKRKDGTIFPTVHSVMELKDEQGVRVAWLSIVRDITARKKAQEALRRGEQRYRTLFDASPVAMGELEASGLLRFLQGLRRMSPKAADALIGPAGARRAEARRGIRLLELNKAGLRFFGLSDGTSLAGKRLQFVERTLADIILNDYRCILDGKKECGGEAAVPVSAKETRSVLWGWTDATAGAEGEARYMVSLLDVTERKRAEETLREREASLRALYENSMVGIALTSPAGHILAANPAACLILERTEEELRRIGRAGILLPHDPRFTALLEERERTGRTRGEVTMIRGDGVRFQAEFTSALFQTTDGLRACTVIQDISDRKAAEERARDLTRQLLTVREEEKRRLSAGLHHDVGSMTVGVTARMQAAEEDLRAGKTRQALAALRDCRELFDRSVKQLKALAVELRPPDLDVLGLSAALRQFLAQTRRATRLRIRFTDATRARVVAPDVQTVLFRVAQASLNNVVEHAEARRVIVRLSAGCDGPGRRVVRLSIQDDGKGFDLSNTAVPSRTNIGLRAMREMVTAQGGQMTVESAPGKGTTVRVAVPAGPRS